MSMRLNLPGVASPNAQSSIPPALAFPPESPRPASRVGSARPTASFVPMHSPMARQISDTANTPSRGLVPATPRSSLALVTGSLLSIDTATPVKGLDLLAAPALSEAKLALPATPRNADFLAPPLSARNRSVPPSRSISDEREAVRTYLSKHRIPDIFASLCEELALARPQDPLGYMANAFSSAQYLDLHAEKCTSISDSHDPLSYAPEAVSSYGTSFPSSMPAPYYSNQSANEVAATARNESAAKPVPELPVPPLTPRQKMQQSLTVSSATKEEKVVMGGVDVHTMRELLKANTRVGGALDPFVATTSIIDECCRLCDCERATIFLINEQRQELEVRVAKGQPQIFVPVGRGIAGTCAQICEPILVPDAYTDPRFDRSHDARTGFCTRNIIAVPITALEDGTTVVGVLQCINKHKDAAFNDADIFILQTLGAQACVTLRNAMLVDVAFAERRKSRALLDIVHSLNLSNGNANVSSVSSQIFTVIQRTTDMVDSDRTTFFLVDHAKQELWSMQGSINLRFPMSKGLAGSVACSGEKINIADAYEDPRFNRETDKRTGYRTRSVLVLPMFGTRSNTSEASTEGEVRSIAEEEDAVEIKRPIIGVLQVINKKDGTPFDESDEEVLRMFLDITGPILEKSMLYQQLNKPAPAKEAARAFGGTTTTVVTTPRRRSNPTSNNTFAEDEENEEED